MHFVLQTLKHFSYKEAVGILSLILQAVMTQDELWLRLFLSLCTDTSQIPKGTTATSIPTVSWSLLELHLPPAFRLLSPSLLISILCYIIIISVKPTTILISIVTLPLQRRPLVFIFLNHNSCCIQSQRLITNCSRV